MPRSALARLIALTIGLVASLVTPGLAVSHGYAHGEEAEHSAPATHPSSVTVLVSQTDHESHHQHGTVTAAVTTRWSAPSPAVLAGAVFVSLQRAESTGERTVGPRSLVAPSSADPPPNPSRAPPVRL